MSKPALAIKLRIYCGDEIAMGPGKAALLEAIADHGSISAAARALGMSYRRAWLLVDTMNRCWRDPLVATDPGAGPRGGARLSHQGAEVLMQYRALQARLDDASGTGEWPGLAAGLLASPRISQKG